MGSRFIKPMFAEMKAIQRSIRLDAKSGDLRRYLRHQDGAAHLVGGLTVRDDVADPLSVLAMSW